jgi:ABC-type transport system involved in cytochrome c biogenesis permease component
MRQHAYRPHLAVEPRTRLGVASMKLFFAAIVLFTLSIALGPRGPEFFDEPWWAIATIAWVAATLASFMTAVVAIVRKGERSIVTITTAVLLAVPVVWIVFELTVPHSN